MRILKLIRFLRNVFGLIGLAAFLDGLMPALKWAIFLYLFTLVISGLIIEGFFIRALDLELEHDHEQNKAESTSESAPDRSVDKGYVSDHGSGKAD